MDHQDACGCNHRQCSIHAEQIAMRYCLRNINKNYKIIIWRWGKCGNLKLMIVVMVVLK